MTRVNLAKLCISTVFMPWTVGTPQKLLDVRTSKATRLFVDTYASNYRLFPSAGDWRIINFPQLTGTVNFFHLISHYLTLKTLNKSPPPSKKKVSVPGRFLRETSRQILRPGLCIFFCSFLALIAIHVVHQYIPTKLSCGS